MGNLKVEYIEKYSPKTVFVETGTHLGDTIEEMKGLFDELHSIEINQQLFENAVKRFDGDVNVTIWNGDSPDILPQILNNTTEQITFWLDGHASGPLKGGKYGGSPLVNELECIKNHVRNDHVIFIDDVRLFGNLEWDGLQKEDVLDLLKEINPKYNIIYLDGYIENDVLLAYIEDENG